MPKYYKVYLEYEDFCLVCKKVPFTKDLYREIITDKIIYPFSKKNENKLTYGYLPNGLPRCYEITNIEAKEWLLNLKETGYVYRDYIYQLQRIESIAKIHSKQKHSEDKIYKNKEKEAGKSIKKTLKKIKQR